MKIAAVIAVAAAVFLTTARAEDYVDRADVRAYMETLQREHDFSAEELNGWFAAAERRDSILEAMSRPAERTLEWHEYRPIFIKPVSVDQGIEFWDANATALARAEAVYGVPAEYVVAIIGVETRWGRVLGKHRVIDALATLAFDYPPRSDFFRKELTQFLLLSREESKDPLTLKGSYAGAMGYGQFIPSSFRAYAVDFDEDGVRDIWSNTTDAIGSVANYFKRHGWQPSNPVVVQVDVTDVDRLDDVANESLELKRTVGELAGLGVDIDGFPDTQPAALFRMEQVQGPEFWVGLNNFYVITRYNRSRMYALAVHQLSQAIAERRLADREAARSQDGTDVALASPAAR